MSIRGLEGDSPISDGVPAAVQPGSLFAHKSVKRGARWGVLTDKKGLHGYIGPKRLLLLFLLVVSVAVAWQMQKRGILDPVLIQRFLHEHPIAGIGIFVAAYAVSVVSTLPTLALNLAAGLFWGPFLGGVMATIGTSLGATAAFFLARTLLGQPLSRRFDIQFVDWLQQEFNKNGWRSIAFLRLNPVFPTGPLNYLLGLTAVKSFTYVWASVLFLVPPSIAVAWIGHEMGTFVDTGDVVQVMRGVLSVSVAIVVLVAIRYGAKYLRYGVGRSS